MTVFVLVENQTEHIANVFLEDDRAEAMRAIEKGRYYVGDNVQYRYRLMWANVDFVNAQMIAPVATHEKTA